MPTKTQLTTIVLATAAIWGLLLLLKGVGLSWSWLTPASTVTGVLAFMLAAFDRWLWRLPFLQSWLVKQPHIGGTWAATFSTTYVDPTTGRAPEPSEAYMSIYQTFSMIRLRLMTTESTSTVIAATTTPLPDGSYRVAAVYLNEPSVALRLKSSIHYGCLVLSVSQANPQRLSGTYWTDRGTAGELVLSQRHRRAVNDIAEARQLLAAHPEAKSG